MLRTVTDTSDRQSGFTLIEVMVALAIMSIGVLSIGVAQLSALRMSTTSSRLSQAMYLAEEQMETFRSMPWGPTFTTAVVDQPDPTNPILPVNGDSASYNRSWTIQPNQAPHNLTEITVTVNWTNATGSRQNAVLRGIKGP